MKSANKPIESNSQTTASSSNSNKFDTNPTATATPLPAEKVDKKEEGLFSFPPPKVTDVVEVKTSDLAAQVGVTNLSQVSEKLAEGLKKAGYKENKYSYFWNDRDEFAIVTAMERVKADGSAFEENRWVDDEELPTARGGEFGKYFEYLIEGKKVYYRVFAFVVTARRSQKSFNGGSPPEFVTALNWKIKGGADLGDGETSTVENALFSEKHKCFALVYLFVNHTSLDAPKSVEKLEKSEKHLQEDLNKDADVHLRKTNFPFGG